MSRCGLPATARDRAALGRAARPCAGAGVRPRFICRARENAVSAEWKVPPENVPLAADHAAQPQRTPLGQLLHGEQRAEVVRDRVEAAGVHDPGAGARRAVAWCATYIRSTNSGSPVRST